MPRIISFGWTSPPLVAGVKTVTRRTWADEYARRIHRGDLMLAYSKVAFHGGKPLALIRLIAEPELEPPGLAPDEDWRREGFEFFHRHPEVQPPNSPPFGMVDYSATSFNLWRHRDADPLWVIRFGVESWIDAEPLREIRASLIAAGVDLGELPVLR